MNPSNVKHPSYLPGHSQEIDSETTPSAMWVHACANDAVLEDNSVHSGDGVVAASPGPVIKLNVSFGPSHQEVFVPAQSTFGDVKKVLEQKIGLEPGDQRLFFRGKEKENDEQLHVVGVKDRSKILILEDSASKERKLEEEKKNDEILKASKAVAVVRTEVDKLAERVTALGVAVDGGTKVSEKEFLMSTELLMKQLLKLDSIDAEGEAKLQRKAEVRRVQNFVDTLDILKERNAHPKASRNNDVTVTTNWETFDSVTGSVDSKPPPVSSPTKVNRDWEQFD